MRKKICVLPIALMLSVLGCAQTSLPQSSQPAAMPYTPSLDVNAMDKNADPCVDFYQYSCGGWKKNNPIPADQPSWDVYGKMTQDNRRVLWGILDRLATQAEGRTVSQQKIGDAFAACADEDRVQSLGAGPMKPELDLIAGMKSKKD